MTCKGVHPARDDSGDGVGGARAVGAACRPDQARRDGSHYCFSDPCDEAVAAAGHQQSMKLLAGAPSSCVPSGAVAR
jgi:hypothetical protein